MPNLLRRALDNNIFGVGWRINRRLGRNRPAPGSGQTWTGQPILPFSRYEVRRIRAWRGDNWLPPEELRGWLSSPRPHPLPAGQCPTAPRIRYSVP